MQDRIRKDGGDLDETTEVKGASMEGKVEGGRGGARRGREPVGKERRTFRHWGSEGENQRRGSLEEGK